MNTTSLYYFSCKGKEKNKGFLNKTIKKQMPVAKYSKF